MPDPQFDILIIGQGLAGSALAWHLINAGQRVCVLDDGYHSASSRVAAGLINPLAGMRFSRRPELGDWLQAAHAWYDQLAVAFGQQLYRPLDMLRLFRSPQQHRFYRRQADQPLSQALLGRAFSAADCAERGLAAPHGGFQQRQTGFVALPLLLDRVREWLQQRHAWQRLAVTYDAIGLRADGVEIGGLQARQLVFCEGARLRFNPWFRDLPLAPDKGEILNLRSGWRPRQIINGAHWLIPLEKGEFRLGSTHEHHQLDLLPTTGGRRQLLEGLHALVPRIGVEVTDHQAGIRPGTSDRYPLLGQHRELDALWVCNGFGARGALSIPWYTRRLADHLLYRVPLPAEADIRRFG